MDGQRRNYTEWGARFLMSPTWETAADWDAAQSETGVHHEQPIGTDWAPADTVEKGYPTTLSGLEAYYTFNEDSGSVINDVAGGYDGALSGGVLGGEGLTGHSGASFDGADDHFVSDTLAPVNTAEFTGICWMRYDGSHDKWGRIYGAFDDQDPATNASSSDNWWVDFNGNKDNLRLRFGGDNSVVNTGPDIGPVAGEWCMIVVRGGGGEGDPSSGSISFYNTSGLQQTQSGTATRTTGNAYPAFGGDDGRYTEATVGGLLYFSESKSDTEIDEIYQAVF